MWLLVSLALLVVVMMILIFSLGRANELFYLRVEGRHVRILRGRLPQRLLDDIVDILQAEPVGHGAVRVVVESQKPQVIVEGDVSSTQAQRLRNTVSMWPVAKIRNAPRRG